MAELQLRSIDKSSVSLNHPTLSSHCRAEGLVVKGNVIAANSPWAQMLTTAYAVDYGRPNVRAYGTNVIKYFKVLSYTDE